MGEYLIDWYGIGNNLALQQPLYQLRSDTKEAFDEAKRLEARWKELEREQKEVYQVRLCITLTSLLLLLLNLCTSSI